MARKTTQTQKANQSQENQQQDTVEITQEENVMQQATPLDQATQQPIQEEQSPLTSEQMQNIVSGVIANAQSDKQIPPFSIPNINGQNITQWGNINLNPEQAAAQPTTKVVQTPMPDDPESQQQTQQAVTSETKNDTENKEKQEVTSGPEWDLGDIVDKETFMKLDFPEFYWDNSVEMREASNNFSDAVAITIGDVPGMFGMILSNAPLIKKYGSLSVACIKENLDHNDIPYLIKHGLVLFMKWMSVYSIIYNEYVLLNKKQNEILTNNGILGVNIISSVIKLIDSEIEAGKFMPIDKCIANAMGCNMPTKEEKQNETAVFDILGSLGDKLLSKCTSKQERQLMELFLNDIGKTLSNNAEKYEKIFLNIQQSIA